MWDDNKDVRFLGNSGGWGVGAWMGWNAERKVHKNYIGIVKEAGNFFFDWLIEKKKILQLFGLENREGMKEFT